ncbi:patatin-like phospholipase family protein [Umezawaea tangerina]|uniref:NTE family protein n=1 Tax=Umezawaea tangerina TaxID=84725 RepID=A0A2T0STI6_9PSEU|nr:patatin-like phospholipase family protein [Umezawaea tangerina]PRY36731.1 NTE family protein [Umezawaea tangerina]
MIELPSPDSRAVVLGGGGALGAGWQNGLLAGLERRGLRLSDADVVIGTSAGALSGARNLLGLDPASLMPALLRFGATIKSDVDERRLGEMFRSMREVAGAADPEVGWKVVGRAVDDAVTAPEDVYVDVFSFLAGQVWPTNFACTGVDVDTGELRVWDRDSGVDLGRAVAASCSIPTLSPAVTVDGRRYLDGGLRGSLNAGVATGASRVIAISCLSLSPRAGESGALPGSDLDRTELASLRADRSRVETVEPDEDFWRLASGPMGMMDISRAGNAIEAGLAQADREHARLASAWG